MKVTIKEVAKVASVSIGTVDRVLHNRGKVAPDKHQAVLDAIKELNYEPSKIASALATRKSNLKIGITYPNVDNCFWSEIDVGIDKALSFLEPFGVELIIEPTNTYNPAEQLEVIDSLVAQNVNGILLTSAESSYTDRIESHIPENIPYASAINVGFGDRRAFHIGPDDYAIGSLAAKLCSFYSGPQAKVLIISPNFDFNGVQQRIAGFMGKTRQDFPEMRILKTIPVPGGTEAELSENVYNMALEQLSLYPSATTIYVPNGLYDHAADAVEDGGYKGKVTVIGHEYVEKLEHYLKEGVVGASIYQRPAQQWYSAIRKLFEYITAKNKPSYEDFVIDCSILMEETISFSDIGKSRNI